MNELDELKALVGWQNKEHKTVFVPTLAPRKQITQYEAPKTDWTMPCQYWERDAMPVDAQDICDQNGPAFPDNPFWSDKQQIRDAICKGEFKRRTKTTDIEEQV